MSDGPGGTTSLDPARVATFRQLLSSVILPVGSDTSADARRVELLSALESLKNTATAVQAMLAVGLDVSVRAQHAAAGIPSDQQGRGVAAQVALARQESPHRGQQLLGLAKDLVRDLPHTMAALRSGALNEFRATVVARESGCLDSPDRQQLDGELFGAGSAADALRCGTRQLAGRARAITCRLDPASVARRAAQAADDRCVTVRPAPDCMTYLTALLPVAHGVAAIAALTRAAASARAAGDERGKGQLMADLLLERVLGSPAIGVGSGTGAPPVVPVTVNLIMSDASLLSGGHEPALLLADGASATPVPAQTARELVADALDASDARADSAGTLDAKTMAWVRRLYADPGGDLVAMTSRQRFVRGGLAEFLRVRDQGICRTPWCDAPVAEHDHVVTAADAGDTAARNIQGYCIACNRAKQAAGWQQRPVDDSRHHVVTLTPAGQRYDSLAPAPPRPAPHSRRSATTFAAATSAA